MRDWWREALSETLSQGDILDSVPHAQVTHPRVHLRKQSVKGFPEAWVPDKWTPDNNGVGRTLAHGRVLKALVISHDCEIDKKRDKAVVQIAPVSQLVGLRPEVQQTILAGEEFALFPLPGVNGVDHYADLRQIYPVPREFAMSCVRVASMTDDARLRLGAQILGFFTRLALDGTSVHLNAPE